MKSYEKFIFHIFPISNNSSWNVYIVVHVLDWSFDFILFYYEI